MAFMIFLKKFEKVEKTGIISTKFSLRCTPSVILGDNNKKFQDYCKVALTFDFHLSNLFILLSQFLQFFFFPKMLI